MYNTVRMYNKTISAKHFGFNLTREKTRLLLCLYPNAEVMYTERSALTFTRHT